MGKKDEKVIDAFIVCENCGLNKNVNSREIPNMICDKCGESVAPRSVIYPYCLLTSDDEEYAKDLYDIYTNAGKPRKEAIDLTLKDILEGAILRPPRWFVDPKKIKKALNIELHRWNEGDITHIRWSEA